jgi:hypothetical protein
MAFSPPKSNIRLSLSSNLSQGTYRVFLSSQTLTDRAPSKLPPLPPWTSTKTAKVLNFHTNKVLKEVAIIPSQRIYKKKEEDIFKNPDFGRFFTKFFESD